ncbi:hypothetical protein HBH56_232890 [Parastagonospora nodorum]|uniref:Uncharacterized protein n=2 Tax=Phaeosphaeria nodorum (strain SN15 / ATCC MYA-4574 / FGSC 10173) TaxID=321614 RepID=A0A7U2IDA9_PHANO|nr:hypothetical protein HBH56_232890 [Parastagonospora nodorum]QRD07705.1 hypothetical protein JI435_162430 [Parastagonospora nodorum SN15]KAH3921408.1 hypothetical protein HBH54_240180 [Parastagonospora nodorum]KAH3967428.1 hypothetical protein HBH52_188910 [Parastagonospora nodorum]KAH3994059.1 hypothetical protein HBI10_194030 [Parastagonospora nodorum]
MDNTSTTTEMEVIPTEDAHNVRYISMEKARAFLTEMDTPIQAVIQQALQSQAKDLAAKFEDTLQQALQQQAQEIAEASLREKKLQSELEHFRDLVKVQADTNHLALRQASITDQLAVESLQDDARGYSLQGSERGRGSDNASESGSPGDHVEEGIPSGLSQPVLSGPSETLRLKEALAEIRRLEDSATKSATTIQDLKDANQDSADGFSAEIIDLQRTKTSLQSNKAYLVTRNEQLSREAAEAKAAKEVLVDRMVELGLL